MTTDRQRHRRSQRNAGLLAASALLASACGTTVPSARGASAGAVDGSGLRAFGTAGTTSNGGTSSTNPLAAGASATGVGPNGNASNTSTSVNPSPAGTTVATGADLDGPGVTSNAIYLAAEYNPQSSQAYAEVGASDLTPGDSHAQVMAVVDWVNKNGGIAGRHVKVNWYQFDNSLSADQNDAAACASWTQDHKTFLLLAGTPSLDTCTAKAGGIGVFTGNTMALSTPDMQKYPMVVNASSMTIDRAMGATTAGLARRGYFGKDAHVGIVTWDNAAYQYGMSHGVNPELAQLGLDAAKVPTAYVPVPSSYGDIAATSAAISSAVLKFQSQNLDHVLILDGPAGVASSGLIVLEWMNQAYSQRYFPTYGLNTGGGLSAITGDVPKQELAGSVGVGWFPSVDLSTTDYQARPTTPQAKLCEQIETQAGQKPANANQRSLEYSYCDRLFFLRDAFAGKPAPLNQSTALAAIDAMGTRYQAIETLATDIARGRHEAAGMVADVTFVDSCGCFRYQGEPYRAG